MPDRRGRWIPLAVLAAIVVTVVLVLRSVFSDEDPYELAERYGAEAARSAAQQEMADAVASVAGDAQPLVNRTTERCAIDPETNTGDIFVNDSEGTLSCAVGRDVVLPLYADNDVGAQAAARQLLGDRCQPEPDILERPVCADGLMYDVFSLQDPAVEDELAEWLPKSPDGRYESVDVGDLIEHAGEHEVSHLLALRFQDIYLEVSLDCLRPGC